MLGYQIQNSVESSAHLKNWLQKNSHKNFNVWGKTPVGSGCDYGVNPENYPWKYSEIFSFKENINGCKFIADNECFTLTFCDLPTDRWGNTATFSTNLKLVDGCHRVGYEDWGYAEYLFPSEWEIEDESDFIEWLEEFHPELVSEVEETTVCNGTANSWRYITTNEEFHSQAWKLVLEEYQDQE